MSENPEWPTEWLRAVLSAAVLRVLADGPTYGYAITAKLRAAGLGTVKGGTLYPLLSRPEATGHIGVEWRAGESGPARKYYELTAEGQAHLTTHTEEWARFSAVTLAHLRNTTEDPHA